MSFECSAPNAVGILSLLLFVGCASGTATDMVTLDDSLGSGTAQNGADDASPDKNDGSSSSNGASGSPSNTNAGASRDSGASTGGSTGSGTGNPPPILSDAGTKADAGPTCTAGTTLCGTTCVDLKSSAKNCGLCGRACPGQQACDGAGACLAPSGCTFASFGGHDYFFCANSKNWVDARAACQSHGLDLALIEDAAENEFIKTKGQRWIGLNDRTTENMWQWIVPGDASVKGITTPFRPWESNEPNNDCARRGLFNNCSRPEGEDCVEIYNSGSWNDGDCGRAQPFVCETY